MSRIVGWLLLAACCGVTGCSAFAARQIETPGHVRPSPDMVKLAEQVGQYRQQEFHTVDGLRIAFWYAAPHAPRMTGNLEMKFHRGRLARYSLTHVKPLPHHPDPPTLGSVVLLPPWGQNAAQLLLWGMELSHAGYVTVMPDLRSQGDSGDAPVGYGPREANDIVQLIHALQAEHQLPLPLYLFGVSYGATVALFAAPDLSKLRGVIALEPYVHPVAVIERAPRSGLFGPRWWSHFIGERTMHKAIARADAKLGIDLASIDPTDALVKSRACTLLLRGSDDDLISGGALAALARQSTRAQYVQISGANHVTLLFGHGIAAGSILDWMRHIPATDDATCPTYAPDAGDRKAHAAH